MIAWYRAKVGKKVCEFDYCVFFLSSSSLPNTFLQPSSASWLELFFRNALQRVFYTRFSPPCFFFFRLPMGLAKSDPLSSSIVPHWFLLVGRSRFSGETRGGTLEWVWKKFHCVEDFAGSSHLRSKGMGMGVVNYVNTLVWNEIKDEGFSTIWVILIAIGWFLRRFILLSDGQMGVYVAHLLSKWRGGLVVRGNTSVGHKMSE